MTQGLMSSDANYPSDAGLPLNGTVLLGTEQHRGGLVAVTIGKTPGTGATYQVQERVGGTWLNHRDGLISGDGAGATGHRVVRCIGDAVRIAAANGTSPGTSTDTPDYVLNVYGNDYEYAH